MSSDHFRQSHAPLLAATPATPVSPAAPSNRVDSLSSTSFDDSDLYSREVSDAFTDADDDLASMASHPGHNSSSFNALSFGKVPDGHVFQVPETKNIVAYVLEFTSPFTFFEYITFVLLSFQLILFFVYRAPSFVFLSLFVFWRLFYNLGLGFLLRTQSSHHFFVGFCKKAGFGLNNSKRRNEWVEYLQGELSKKLGKEVEYESLPLEFKSWLLFRSIADLILVNDFASYVMFAISFYKPPNDGLGATDYLRFFGGAVLLLFNFWVKIDAHRVVKDFAWYWGDFFFAIESNQTFDGVFELAPHPMYSLGYIGFYGTALIAQSYWVLFISLGAHIAQFLFLYLVEIPHNEKTYGSRDSNKQQNYMDHEIQHLYFRRDLIVFKNFDWFRSSDIFVLVIASYSIVIAFVMGPADTPWKLGLYV
ncbi:phosphatidylethanolamine N-methyltransferase, partial [Nowakowskiella sp. JEL0078]